MNKDWHVEWRVNQYGRLHDKAEALVGGSAAFEVAKSTIDNACDPRAHLLKQFGGAGEDIQARQDRHEAGMPTNPGGIAFPSGTVVPEN
jgi:hypothetical protein